MDFSWRFIYKQQPWIIFGIKGLCLYKKEKYSLVVFSTSSIESSAQLSCDYKVKF